MLSDKVVEFLDSLSDEELNGDEKVLVKRIASKFSIPESKASELFHGYCGDKNFNKKVFTEDMESCASALNDQVKSVIKAAKSTSSSMLKHALEELDNAVTDLKDAVNREKKNFSNRAAKCFSSSPDRFDEEDYHLHEEFYNFSHVLESIYIPDRLPIDPKLGNPTWTRMLELLFKNKSREQMVVGISGNGTPVTDYQLGDLLDKVAKWHCNLHTDKISSTEVDDYFSKINKKFDADGLYDLVPKYEGILVFESKSYDKVDIIFYDITRIAKRKGNTKMYALVSYHKDGMMKWQVICPSTGEIAYEGTNRVAAETKKSELNSKIVQQFSTTKNFSERVTKSLFK